MKKLIAMSFVVAGLWAGEVRAENFSVDPVHSTVLFKINHLGMSDFYGRFNQVAGKMFLDKNAPEKSSVELTIHAASVDTNEAKRDEHLRGPDFFNAKQFPKITFKSTGVKALGGDEYEVTGDLTLKGVTKPVTMKVVKGGEGTDPMGKYRVGFNSVTEVKRSDFGMNFMPDKLGDEVELLLSVEGLKG